MTQVDAKPGRARSQILILGAGFLLVAFIWFLDYWTGREISFSIFYLIPISLVTWETGRGPGLVFSMLSAIAWFAADQMAGDQYSNFVIPYWNTMVRLGFFAIVVLSLARIKKDNETRELLASTDSLTGLKNSRTFLNLARQEIERSWRDHRPLTVAYIDCDNFKLANDTLGHQIGDEILCLVAELIKGNTRSTDIAARMGGDEFIILLPETDEVFARGVMARIQSLLTAAMHKKQWPVTLSVGAVTFWEPPDSLEAMIRKADHLMYEVKNGGKNGMKQAVIGKS